MAQLIPWAPPHRLLFLVSPPVLTPPSIIVTFVVAGTIFWLIGLFHSGGVLDETEFVVRRAGVSEISRILRVVQSHSSSLTLSPL
jgi:hypothetical protein